MGVGIADVAGFSLGGTIAMRMAIDHPELVKRLVLVATSSRVAGRPPIGIAGASRWSSARIPSCGRRWT